jgi:DNA-binding transcriptional MerR regulator
VARMVPMPVATLRVWEQRYQAVQPTTAPSGHRLYSQADVQRVVQLRQLTERGHAIGAIAGLDLAQLQALAQQQEHADASGDLPHPRPVRALRLVVVGHAFASRLQRSTVALQLARPVKVAAVFDSLAEAARAATSPGIDVLVCQLPELQASVPPELKAAQAIWQASQVAVVYRFAGGAAKKVFANTGALVVHEPLDDTALGAWVGSLEATLATARDQPVTPSEAPTGTGPLAGSPVAPRRFDDTALTAIAGLPSSVACDCPRHVAELLMQLASFEAYSAGCLHRSPADAELHAYLQQVAGASRRMFESALESVARHEGLTLP